MPQRPTVDIERWIAAGKSILMRPSIKTTPLLTAIDAGFHGLIELLARNETRQEIKDRARQEAVGRKRLDLVQMLVENGAANSVRPVGGCAAHVGQTAERPPYRAIGRGGRQRDSTLLFTFRPL